MPNCNECQKSDKCRYKEIQTFWTDLPNDTYDQVFDNHMLHCLEAISDEVPIHGMLMSFLTDPKETITNIITVASKAGFYACYEAIKAGTITTVD